MGNRAWLNQQVILRKTSLIDYPGLISAVIFFPGCNLRCPWCHNRELVLGEKTGTDFISLEKAVAYIKKRRGVLGGVVLSGGEPTLFASLGDLIILLKSFGLKTKLDTNGLLPGVLELLLASDAARPDYIAMDVKTIPERYAEFLSQAGKNPGEDVRKSIAIIRASTVQHEFRSIELPPPPDGETKPYFGKEEAAALASLIGSSTWHMRKFIPGNCVDTAWDNV